MNALEDYGKKLEMDSLVNSEPVKVLVVLSYMCTRMEVQDSAKGKVLDSLKFCHVRRGKIEEKRVALVKFGSDNGVD